MVFSSIGNYLLKEKDSNAFPMLASQVFYAWGNPGNVLEECADKVYVTGIFI